MKPVLLITSLFPPFQGGVQRYLSEMFSVFGEDELVVLTAEQADHGDAVQEFDERFAGRVVRMPFVRQGVRPTTLLVYRRARELVREYGIGHVFAGETLPSGVSARGLGVSYDVFTYGRDVLLADSQPAKRLLVYDALSHARKIYTISDYTRGLITEHWGHLGTGDKIGMLPPGVDLHQFSPQPTLAKKLRDRHGIRDDEQVLVTIGRLDPRKGVDTMISYLPDVIEQCPGVRYVVVGRGEYRDELGELARTCDVDDRVLFLDEFVPDEELAGWYSMADVFVTLNRHSTDDHNVEGFGMVFVEANACGTPVVAGRTGGAVDAVSDGESGYLVDPGEQSDVVGRVVELLRDNDLRQQMGEAGLARARDKFSWDRIRDDFRALLPDSVLA